MKTFIYIFAILPFVFTGPAQLGRIYLPEEDDPEYKRFIYVEKEDGKVELVDLMKEDEVETRASVSVSDVSYDLYTGKNTNSPFLISNGDVNRLGSSNFDPKKVSLFVAHGWNNNRNSEVNRLIREAALANYDINLFIIDWSKPASALYISAKKHVETVGKIVGNFINSIQDTYRLTGSSFILTGHSLGAHVVGNAGAVVKSKVGHIIGMDPAGPLFTVGNTDNRLDSSDGNFVQIIHTNGQLLGFSSSIGHADYYPNGGNRQPGCGLDLVGTCAHSRAYEYFAESLTRGAVFQGLFCSSYSNYQKGSCSGNRQSPMGQLAAAKTIGDFFLDTSSKNPYGLS